MKWISVKDKLPETDDLVLTFSTEITGHKYRLIVPNMNISTFPTSVTHWMPLPESPKSEEQ